MIGFTVHKSGRFVTNPAGVKRDFREAMKSALRTASFAIRKSLREKMSKAGGRDPFWGRTTDPTGLLVRTGGTRARLSPGGRVYEAGKTMTTAVGSPDDHVLQLEEGGTVTPRGGFKFLRIPTAAAQTHSGADRWAGQSIRNIPGAFLRTSKSGKLWALRAKGKRGVERLYLLVPSFETRGRHMFRNTTNEMRPEVVRLTGQHLSVAVAKANS